jgi:GT2 family glycosyltransferase
MESASVVIVTHNSAELVGPVLDALEADQERPGEIIVVDSASTDDTLAVVERHTGGKNRVRLIALDDNVGFAAGTHAGAAEAGGTVLVFLGHDTVPRPGWLAPLVAAATQETVGAAMATIEDAGKPGTFNTSGGHLTYFGLAWVSDLGEPIPAGDSGLTAVPFPSGAAMAITRDRWGQFGGFRQSFFMYHEDTDLGWRLRLADLGVVRVADSRVLHHYDFARSPEKLFWLERNRRTLLSTNYRFPTRVILTPAFALAGAGIWFVARRDGWAEQRRKAWVPGRGAGASRREGRRLVEQTRVLGDSAMLVTMDWSVSGIPQVRAPRGSQLIDAVLGAYLRLAIPIVARFDRRAGLSTNAPGMAP